MKSKSIVNVNLPNVDIQKCIDNLQHNRNIKIGSGGVSLSIHPFVEALALKHPEWRIVCLDGAVRNDDEEGTYLCATKFAVYDKREKLGEIGSEFSNGRGKDMYVITNHRTAKTLTRANSFKSSDVAKAVKHVEKYFVPRNSEEIVEQMYELACGSLKKQSLSKQVASRRIEDQLKPSVWEFVREHVDAYMATLPDTNVRANVETLLTLHVELDLLDSIANTNALTSEKYFVVQQGGVYLVTNGDKLTEHSADTLPEHIKHKLGILKLVQDEQAVSGIGYRCSESTFILIEGIKNEY